MLNVDRSTNNELANIADAAHRRWKSSDPAHLIYRDFILEERNNILKEYRYKVHPLATVPVALRLKLVNPETGKTSYLNQAVEFKENLFRPLVEGYGEGEDAREVFEEAINWWERELTAIDKEFVTRVSP